MRHNTTGLHKPFFVAAFGFASFSLKRFGGMPLLATPFPIWQFVK
jgi:hypothetical protein